MPKPGFRSITIAEDVYERFYDEYEKGKPNLRRKGVNSFAAFVTYMIEERMRDDKIFAKHAPMLEEVATYDDRVVIKDNKHDRIADVVIRDGGLYCQLCEESNCVHVGFVFALPEVYESLAKHGVKPPR